MKYKNKKLQVKITGKNSYRVDYPIAEKATITRVIKLHTSPLVELTIIEKVKIIAETKYFYVCEDGHKINRMTVRNIKK